MTMNSFKVLAATMALATMVGLASRGAAQPVPSPAPFPPPAQTAKAGGALTPETLKETLVKLGYEPREVKAGDGVLYFIKVSRGGLTYEVNVNLSPNREKLWTSTVLAILPQGTELPAARLLKLLELNQKVVGPSHFGYDANGRAISMNRAMDNREVTLNLLKEHIDASTAQCEATRDHWDVAKWTEMKTVAAPK
jgi:hypothetical protein